ncbi:MAG: SIS domain-containing protein [Acidobacteriaceae bacterium]|nr:SIS domain-containing protein [Acidobacteriaceae bacterium]
MNSRLLENILAQPDSLRAVASYQFGEGREALIRSSEFLRSRKRIVLTGMGGSFSACIPLAYFFAAHGVSVSLIETSELLYFEMPILDPETAVILVSRSGESVEATKLLKAQHGSVVGITNVPHSTLAANASQTILLGCPPDELVAIQTYTASVVVLLLLGAAYVGELDLARSELDSTLGALTPWVRECLDQSQRWISFFASASPLYVLGRGPSLASVTLGALLFHEVAKMPAVGMSAAQFRHGPVEVAGERFRALIIGSQEATVEWDAALAKDLTNVNSQVRWIGPAINPAIASLCSWPDNLPARFAPIAEIIPIQLAAYQAAKARGIPLGKFRFAPAITTSETGLGASVPAT